MLSDKLKEVFPDKFILGMIHCKGVNEKEKVDIAMKEIKIYEEEGVDGYIVENYFGSCEDIKNVIGIMRCRKNEGEEFKSVIGVNVLPNEYTVAFDLVRGCGGKFIQLDYIAGRYASGRVETAINEEPYMRDRKIYEDIIVFGGVWPKYYMPVKGSDLKEDLKTAMERADAIVVTGTGTGSETPLDKIKKFRDIIGDFPLVVGAGLTLDSVKEQMTIADGAIVGTYFKEIGDTNRVVDKKRVKDLMDVVKALR